MSVDVPSLWDLSSSCLSCLCRAPRTSVLFWFFLKTSLAFAVAAVFLGKLVWFKRISRSWRYVLEWCFHCAPFPVAQCALSVHDHSQLPLHQSGTRISPGISCSLGKGVCRQFPFGFVMISIPSYILHASLSLVCCLWGVFVLFVFLIDFYWSIIALQCGISFFCTAEWISSTYSYNASFLGFLPF